MPDDYIHIFDTTLRDGEQAPGCSMTSEEKLRVAFQLERLGVDIIEAGFPISSEEDFESGKENSAEDKGLPDSGALQGKLKGHRQRLGGRTVLREPEDTHFHSHLGDTP